MDTRESDLLTRKQAAAILRCSPQNITLLVQSGKLPGIKRGTGNGHLFVYRADIEAYMKPVGAKPTPAPTSRPAESA